LKILTKLLDASSIFALCAVIGKLVPATLLIGVKLDCSNSVSNLGIDGTSPGYLDCGVDSD